MTDADAPFLDAIRAAPGDPQPHTIYADWLFDQPSRAPEAALRYVLLDPDDDSHRLAYADRIEETAGEVACPHCAYDGCTQWGEPCAHCAGSHCLPDGRRELAEFIRVQCELARTTRPQRGDCRCKRSSPLVCGVCRDRREWDRLEPLRRRERKLWAARGQAWGLPGWNWSLLHDGTLGANFDLGANEPLEISASPRCECRRGFVASITCTAADLLAHAAAVFGAAPVERVVLGDKRPLRPSSNGANFVWMRGQVAAPSILPQALFDWLGEGPRRDFAPYGSTMVYPTEAAAQADLSAACVRWGRQQAGLPAWGPAGVRAGA